MAESKSQRSRYTPPPSRKNKRPSPTWYIVLVLALFGVAVAAIILNYVGAFGETSNIWLFGGLGLILVAFILTVRIR